MRIDKKHKELRKILEELLDTEGDELSTAPNCASRKSDGCGMLVCDNCVYLSTDKRVDSPTRQHAQALLNSLKDQA